jgi:hypothetical protein
MQGRIQTFPDLLFSAKPRKRFFSEWEVRSEKWEVAAFGGRFASRLFSRPGFK